MRARGEQSVVRREKKVPRRGTKIGGLNDCDSSSVVAFPTKEYYIRYEYERYYRSKIRAESARVKARNRP